MKWNIHSINDTQELNPFQGTLKGIIPIIKSSQKVALYTTLELNMNNINT
jgi:hypothetical protein